MLNKSEINAYGRLKRTWSGGILVGLPSISLYGPVGSDTGVRL